MQQGNDQGPYSQNTSSETPGYGSPLPPPAGYATNAPPVNGTLILIMGILGIVVCQICAIIAWVMGNNALKVLDAGGDQSQRQMVTIGRILGIIGTCIMILVIVVYGAIIIFAIAGGAASGFKR